MRFGTLRPGGRWGKWLSFPEEGEARLEGSIARSSIRYMMYFMYLVGYTVLMSSTEPIHYDSFTEARKSLKHILDSAEDGAVVSIERGDRVTVVTDRDRLRDLLIRAVPSTARVIAEADAWVILIPDSPFAAEGQTLDDAVDDLIENLRDYASEWPKQFASAPNHAGNWALVQLANLSTDEALREWLTSGPSE